MAPDLLPRYQSEASHLTTRVSKHSAATAGQLPLGTGRECLVDPRRIFGTSNRENFTVMPQRRLQSEVPSNSDLEWHSVAVQETNSGSLSCPSTLLDVRRATRSTHTGSQSTGAAFIDFLSSLVFVETPVLLLSCTHDATCAMTGADGPNSA